MGSRDLIRGFQAVHFRHGDVHDDYIRIELNCLFDRLFAVAGFGANGPVGPCLYEVANSEPHHLVVVSHENSDRSCRRGGGPQHLLHRNVLERQPRNRSESEL